MAHFDAFITDICAQGRVGRARYEFSDISLALVTERTSEIVIALAIG
jgi:hypothetical protein